MKRSRILRVALGCLVAAAFIATLSAQKFEIHPYAGYFFPDTFSLGTTSQELKDEGIYGVKGGLFVTKNIEVEGNFGYINHFELEGSDPESRGILWEASGLYHFRPFRGLRPYVVGGVGGISALIDDDETGFVDPRFPVFEDNDTFFTFSYGGGVKTQKLWGPVGLRADVRGRTIPNLHGESSTWLELTGGITISWGE